MRDAAAFARGSAKPSPRSCGIRPRCGIDIVGDGEMGRFGFIPYVNERLSGHRAAAEPSAPATGRARANTWRFRNITSGRRRCRAPPAGAPPTRWVCTGPIGYRGQAALAARHRRSEGGDGRARGRQEAFMPAVSPANLADWDRNEYYKTHEEISASQSPTRCARNTARSSMPASCCRSTTRGSPAIGSCTRNRARRLPQMGEATRRALNHALAAFPPSGCATTPATASTWGRASTTSN